MRTLEHGRQPGDEPPMWSEQRSWDEQYHYHLELSDGVDIVDEKIGQGVFNERWERMKQLLFAGKWEKAVRQEDWQQQEGVEIPFSHMSMEHTKSVYAGLVGMHEPHLTNVLEDFNNPENKNQPFQAQLFLMDSGIQPFPLPPHDRDLPESVIGKVIGIANTGSAGQIVKIVDPALHIVEIVNVGPWKDWSLVPDTYDPVVGTKL